MCSGSVPGLLIYDAAPLYVAALAFPIPLLSGTLQADGLRAVGRIVGK